MTDSDGGLGQELRSLRLAQDMSGGATFVVDLGLRMVSASGPDLAAAGMDGDALRGQQLTDILGPSAPTALLEAYGSAVAGRDADLEFVDQVSGRLFRVEIRPLRGVGETVIGAVARSTDLSAMRAKEAQLEHAAALNVMGVSTYDVRSGWHHDQCTMDLLGLDDPTVEAAELIEQAVLPEDREGLVASWRLLRVDGGRATVTYRVRSRPGADVRPGSERRIQCTIDVVIGQEGQLLRVVSTQIDVTAASRAAAEIERARQRVHADRLTMVRDFSAVLTSAHLSIGDIIETVSDLAAVALGGGTSLAELSADGSGLVRSAVSHQDGATKETMARWFGSATGVPGPMGPLRQRVIETGRAWNSNDVPDWRQAFEAEEGRPPFAGLRHLVILPVCDRARVVGLLAILRTDGSEPFVEADIDLAQILADRAGAAIISDRAVVSEIYERERRRVESLLLDDARSQRRGLVERLSATESRERRLLAEAVHDEPIQLIAAARLRVMALGRRLDKEAAAEGGPARQPTHDETARIGTILETAMERLRLLIVALSPQDFEDGLVAALGEVADGTFRGTQTVVTCTGPEALPLTAEQQRAALLILREALVNARQHANAVQVVVQVQVEPTQTVLSVVDDGVGSADIGPRKGHLGMVSMRARAEDAGGQLTVESAVAVGTTVVLTFPLPD